MNFSITGNIGNKKGIGLKRLKPVFEDDLDDTNDDDFETVMAEKAAKVNKQLQEPGLLDSYTVDELISEKAEPPTIQGPKYLNQLLESRKQRINDRLILLQNNVDRKIAKLNGLVFESQEYKSQKQEIDRLTQEIRHQDQEDPEHGETFAKIEKIETIENVENVENSDDNQLMEIVSNLIKSKITNEDLAEYKNRFWDRHPELKR